MTIVSRPHARNLVKWAKDRPEVIILSADLTASCEADDFRDSYPERFFSMGMAEQNMISFAAGLAREGFRPYVHSFAVFLTRRPFDQVAMSVAYPNLPVRLVGFLPGLTTPGGVTHQAIDDLALMRVLPNMTILECGDATEVESVLDITEAVPGPVYIRMLRGQVPRLFPPSNPMELGKSRQLSKGTDLTLLTTGICTEEGLRAGAVLRRAGLSLNHLHISTIKPFNDPEVAKAIAETPSGVLTLENHSIIGGLGSAVAEMMAEQGLGVQLKRLGLKDIYAQGASRAYLMRRYGLDARAVIQGAEELMNREFNNREEELQLMQVGLENDEERVEDL